MYGFEAVFGLKQEENFFQFGLKKTEKRKITRVSVLPEG